MSIEIKGVGKSFGNFRALGDINLDIGAGELVALLGPSGSGKTTLLRIIAGLEAPDTGDVRLAGASAVGLSAGERGAGFVFQHYALFRHLTVFENIAFGLRVRPRGQRPGEASIRQRVSELLSLVQLDGLAGRYPSQLSGGQRQRVALARALAIDPKVLLLDEPFGALDAQVRKELRRWLRRLHKEMQVTSVFVTHDQEEALEVADRVVVMRHGGIEQVGTPEAVYDDPATPFVFRFLGHANEIPCRVRNGRIEAPRLLSGIAVAGPPGAADVQAFVRPHDLEVSPAGGNADGSIRYLAFSGPLVRLEVALAGSGQSIEVEMPRVSFRRLGLALGSAVDLQARRARIFSRDSAGISHVEAAPEPEPEPEPAVPSA